MYVIYIYISFAEFFWMVYHGSDVLVWFCVFNFLKCYIYWFISICSYMFSSQYLVVHQFIGISEAKFAYAYCWIAFSQMEALGCRFTL